MAVDNNWARIFIIYKKSNYVINFWYLSCFFSLEMKYIFQKSLDKRYLFSLFMEFHRSAVNTASLTELFSVARLTKIYLSVIAATVPL